jgi:hypothetical protein
LFIGSILLELFENFQRWRNVSLSFSVLSDETAQSNSKLLSNQTLNFIRENPIGLLVPEKVKICLIFFKLFSNEVKLIGKLVVFLGDSKEVLSANGFDNTISFGDEFLKLLGIVTDKAICTEA